MINEHNVSIRRADYKGERADSAQYYCPGPKATYTTDAYQCNSDGTQTYLCPADKPNSCGLSCYDSDVQSCVLVNSYRQLVNVGTTSTPGQTITPIREVYRPIYQSVPAPTDVTPASSVAVTTVVTTATVVRTDSNLLYYLHVLS